MSTQQFYVHGRYLGQRTIPDWCVIPGLTTRRQFSLALFCMRCGEVWGRLVTLDAKLTQCVCRPCERHGDGRLSRMFHTPDVPDGLAVDWPKPALQWELSRELDLVGEDYTTSPGFEAILDLWCEKETA